MKLNVHASIYSLAFLLFIGANSCRQKFYTATNFDEKTINHKKVAILPAEMIFTGIRPQNMTDTDISKTEELESAVFQQFLYNNILKYSRKGKYYTTVSFQNTTATLQLLDKNNISIRESWKMNAEELKRLLGVDAVVRMKVEKERYMSDLASLGISVGQTVLNRIGGPVGIAVPVSNRTSLINSSCSILSDDVVLWNDAYERSSDYYTPGRQVISDITEKFGKRFPYKKKK